MPADGISVMSRDEIIKIACLQFHTAANPKLGEPTNELKEPTNELKEPTEKYNFSIFPDNPNFTFGTLHLKIADTPMLTQEQVLDSNNDISGSMSDLCNDGKTKMQHATHTLKNIVTSLANSSKITMATYGFDDRIEQIFPDTKVTPSNVAELRAKLDNLQPRGSTDIYQSLETQKARAAQRPPNMRQTNLMMTDGQANLGKSIDYSEMSKQVAPNCTNIFIGFGGDHNATGLQTLAAAQPNGSYFYVAEIEKAGLVFGEIIHMMLYTALTNITIKLENAEIYDYKTNTWSTQLRVPNIVSEATKTYHIRSATVDQASAKIFASSTIHDEQDPSLIEDDITQLPLLQENGDTLIPVDLSLYMLRQRTQELMFKAHQQSLETESKLHYNPEGRETQKAIRCEMIQYLKFLRQYSKEQNLEDNEMLQTLITDLVVILKTFGSQKATMYSGARSDSQGRQTSNNVSYISPNDVVRCPPPPRRMVAGLRRQNAGIGFDDDNDNLLVPGGGQTGGLHEDEDEDEDYLQQQPQLRPQLSRTNTTPKQIAIMREVSAGASILQELEDNSLPIPPL